MRLNPALGSKVHGDAGGQQGDGNSKRAYDPRQLDAAFQHEVIQDAEDQHQDCGFSEEGRAPPSSDEDEIQ